MTPIIRRGWAAAFVLVLVLGSNSGPQAAQAPAERQPTFRAETSLVEVDVRVTDKDGRFVTGLTRDDFEIIEDGRPQTLTTFSFSDLPVARPAAIAAGSAAPPEPDVTTNATLGDGRMFVMLLDAPSTAKPGAGERQLATYDEYVRRFARAFVEKHVVAGDLVAVVNVEGTSTVNQAFTSSTRLLTSAIDRYGRGLSGHNDLTMAEKISRNLTTYRVIQEVSERLGLISGRRKAILWIGGQVELDPGSLICLPPDPDGDCSQLSIAAPSLIGAYRDAVGAATRNNVGIYPVDPSGLTTELGTRELKRTAALRKMAEETGGLAVVGTNNIEDRYGDIDRDTRTYYVLGYTPATTHRDGAFHPIQVRLKRPGLNVRARPGYYAPKPDARPPVAQPVPIGISAAALNALRLPVPVRGLSVDVFTSVFNGPTRDRSVVIGGQVSGALRLDPAERIAITYQVFDLEGRVQTGQYKVFTIDLKPDTRIRVEESGLHFVDRVFLPPGRFELRLVAEQPGGSVGSVVTTLDIPELKEVLHLSGVLLAASSTALNVVTQSDEPLRQTLGSDPTAIRRFPRGDIVTAFGEVYGSAADVQVAGILMTATGEEVQREPGFVSRRLGIAGAPDAWRYNVEFNLSDVAPGQYVLIIEVGADAQSGRSTQRRLPFIVTE
jgi:VWFA-related protein